MSAASNSGAPAPIPEFDAVILGRSFACRRAADRLRDDLYLSVCELVSVTSATYDDIDNRWEFHLGRFVIARAKFVIDGDGTIHLQGREDTAIDPAAVTAHGFPNLFRPVGTDRIDSLGYTVACIEYMRTHGHDYSERRLRTPVADDDFPELSFDRPIPAMWIG
ncbi:hypothetical protein HCA61_17605 [Rhodococcus sp. HNM0563]|uniref:hypothetical protein n=1 Tax=Rhodococcus sp. HNM0563 TaxID=2716339 RepID=UPI00146E17E3|nr:hypothetical protein [Rhodococcus sp. HNM0563]NLU64068.1 hypothetical protein [Rhodococcus sp. HNM0563]